MAAVLRGGLEHSIDLAQHGMLALEPTDPALVEGSCNHHEKLFATFGSGRSDGASAPSCDNSTTLLAVSSKSSCTLFSCAAVVTPRHSRHARRMRCTCAWQPRRWGLFLLIRIHGGPRCALLLSSPPLRPPRTLPTESVHPWACPKLKAVAQGPRRDQRIGNWKAHRFLME